MFRAMTYGKLLDRHELLMDWRANYRVARRVWHGQKLVQLAGYKSVPAHVLDRLNRCGEQRTCRCYWVCPFCRQRLIANLYTRLSPWLDLYPKVAGAVYSLHDPNTKLITSQAVRDVAYHTRATILKRRHNRWDGGFVCGVPWRFSSWDAITSWDAATVLVAMYKTDDQILPLPRWRNRKDYELGWRIFGKGQLGLAQVLSKLLQWRFSAETEPHILATVTMAYYGNAGSTRLALHGFKEQNTVGWIPTGKEDTFEKVNFERGPASQAPDMAESSGTKGRCLQLVRSIGTAVPPT